MFTSKKNYLLFACNSDLNGRLVFYLTFLLQVLTLQGIWGGWEVAQEMGQLMAQAWHPGAFTPGSPPAHPFLVFKTSPRLGQPHPKSHRLL